MGQEVAPPKLALVGLGKRFGGLRAVSACSFDIAPGTVHALIGPSGTGKSVLMRSILRLLPRQSGTITILGQNYDDVSEENRIALDMRLGEGSGAALAAGLVKAAASVHAGMATFEQAQVARKD